MAKISFNNNGQLFFTAVKKSVDAYFSTSNIKKTGNWKLYAKTMFLIPLAVLTYMFLLLQHYSPLVGILLSFLLGLTLVSIAFNVMHDACHGSYSSKKWVNSLLSLTMNALGSNSFIWKIKHNIIHHTYTNVDGIDDDIAKSPLLRLCPTQEWKPMHRFQYLYMFILYSLSTILWVYFTDILKYFNRKIVVTEMNISPVQHFNFWISKVLYVFFYVALPVFFVGWLHWVVGYLVVNMTMGLVLALVFQLAHIVEKTTFEAAKAQNKTIDMEWAVHEIKTTANFAQTNPLITWFVGGLNYQVEHHLFPRVSHIHYKAISKIVQQQCRIFQLPYHNYPTIREAVMSHIKIMKQLGERTNG
ncbi:MAG: acyl-CoA desaturase [Flavisolibacter sp.]